MPTIIRDVILRPRYGTIQGDAFKFRTTVLYQGNGASTRRSHWEVAQGFWTVSLGPSRPTDADYIAFRNLKAANRMRKYGFWLYDYADNFCATADYVSGHKRYQIETGDQYLRPLYKTEAVAGGYRFYVPVAFADDHIPEQVISKDLIDVPTFGLEEIIDPVDVNGDPL